MAASVIEPIFGAARAVYGVTNPPQASQKRPPTLLLQRVGVDLWPDNPSWRRAIRIRLPFKTAIWLTKEWR